MNNKVIVESFIATNVLVDSVVYSSVLTNLLTADDAIKAGTACLVVSSAMSIISYLNNIDFPNKVLKK